MDPQEAKKKSSQVFLTEAYTSPRVPEVPTHRTLDSTQQKTVPTLISVDSAAGRSSRKLPSGWGKLLTWAQDTVTKKREEGKDSEKLSDDNSEDSAKQEALKSRQIRIWTKMTAKISFPEPSEDYYAHTPIKPGIWFWKYLLANPRTSLKPLAVRVPDMLAVFDVVRWATFGEDRGRMEVKSEFGIGSFYKSFERFRDGLNPCAVLRIPGSAVTEMKAVLLNWFDFGEKVMKNQLPSTCLVQRLIHCHGSRPTIIRLFYIAQSRLNKASYAFSISNTDTAMSKYAQGKYVVCAEYYDGIEITPQYGTALASVRDAGEKLVDYLQLLYYIRIEEIVFDFVRDERNDVWLLGCKGFKVDMAVQRVRELRLSEEEGKSTAEIRALHMEKLDEQLSAIHCKLCLLPYKPFEMKHSLPFKVLLQYKQHTYRSERKLLDLSHLRVSSVDFLSHCVSVCEICYMLLVHEYELIETEMKLAALLNVPVKPPQVLGAFQYDHPNFMPALMHQWRLLFYFQSLESEHSCIITDKLYLQYSFLGIPYIYKMKLRWTGAAQAKLNVSRLYYFFAVRDSAVLKFCENTVINLKLSRSKTMKDVVATGECRPLSLFTSLLPESSSIVQSFDVLFFQEDQVICKLRLKLGFACDKQVNAKALPVTISRFSTLYVPEPSFFTSDSLPDSWMEAFESDYRGLSSSRLLDSSEELNEMYTPVLGKRYISSNCPNNRSQESRRTQSLSSGPFLINFSIPLIPIPAFKPQAESPSKRRSKRGSESTAASSRVLYLTESITKLRSPTLISSRRIGPESLKSEDKREPVCDNAEVDSFGDIDDEADFNDKEVIEMVNRYVDKRISKGVARTQSQPLLPDVRVETPVVKRKKRIRIRRDASRGSLTSRSPYLTLLPSATLKSARLRL